MLNIQQIAKYFRSLIGTCLLWMYTYVCGGVAYAADQAPLNSGNHVGNIAKIAAYLVFIVLIIFVVSSLIRKFGSLQSSAAGNLKILGSLPVGTRERVMLIEVGGNQILIGVSPGSVRTLQILDKPIEISDKQVPSFRNIAQKIQDQWRIGSSK